MNGAASNALPANVADALARCPHELLFVTVSGAHLYGFESGDSDWDLRGSFIAPLERVLSLRMLQETYEVMDKAGTPEVDLVAHECAKFFRLLLKHNGYVLEQIFSPLVVHTTPEFEELKRIASRCICRQNRHHFFHFGVDQWRAVTSRPEPTVKGLLYTYRPLLAGIHLMRTGRVESNLRLLNDEFAIPEIVDLIHRKRAGQERMVVPPAELGLHRPLFDRLCRTLDEARETSPLPEASSGAAELDTLLLRIRLRGRDGASTRV